MSDPFGKTAIMSETNAAAVAVLGNEELLAATRQLAHQMCQVEADLLVHLGEIDERRLYLDLSYSSMFMFCLRELRFSEDVACNRIAVARAGRRFPSIIAALRAGRVHVSGLRVLAPYVTQENQYALLANAAGKSKREIQELVVGIAPQPYARAIIAPLGPDAFKIQFTANRRQRDKLLRARDLLRHRIPDGDLAAVIEAALDVLIEQVEKERFATGRKPREGPVQESGSRHIPDAVKRQVYERDGGRCTFVDERGHRCEETGALEFDHLDGFARTPVHDADRIRLLCRPHNQHAADIMYGRAFMEKARARAGPSG
jgi:hypothetical protein